MKPIKYSTYSLAAAATALLVTTAQADLITGVSILEDDGTLPNAQMTSLDAVDGTGLSSPVSFTSTHSTTWNQHWYSSIVAGAYITVDLGANYDLDTIHVWNENENNAGRLRGLKDARIAVSPDANPANLVTLTTDGTGGTDNATGDFLFPIGDGNASYAGFALDLASITNATLLDNVRLVKIETITNHGSSGGSGLAEIQFGGTPAGGGGDTTPPTVSTLTPADDATGVATPSNLVAVFDEPITLGTSGDITIRNLTNPADTVISLPGPDPDGTVAVSGAELTIDPAVNLAAGDEYAVLIGGSVVEDLAGNPFAGISDTTIWSFTTDNTPPTGTDMGPMAGATGVSATNDLTLTFGEDVQLGTGSITIHLASDDSVVETIAVTGGGVLVDGLTVTIDPLDDLAFDTEYYVNITAGAFTDLSGNAYAGIGDSTTWSFTTGSEPSPLITGITVEDATTGSNASMSPSDAIDGQGLSENTPALTGTHSTTWSDHWWGSGTTPQLTVDLEANYAVDTIHLWNYNESGQNARGLQNVEIYVSPDDNLANLVKLTTDGTGTQDNGSGDFLFPRAPSLGTYEGFDLDLSGVTNSSLLANARLVRIQGLGTYGDASGGLAEIQFGGVPSTVSTAIVLAITPSTTTPGSYDFSWNSKDGKVYDLVSNTDLSTTPDTWPVYMGQGNIVGTSPNNALSDIAGAEAVRFFAVVERDVFAEDFEDVTGPGIPADWSTSNNDAGTAWEVGAPSGTAFGPDTAANGNQCAGTNIGSDYTSDAEASLVTKAFTVPATGATLNFSQFIDTEADPSPDLGSIRLLNADDDTPLAGGEIASDLQGDASEWTSESIPLPAAANGLEVKIEFRFTSNDTLEFAGFYIDDVLVTAN